MSKQIRICVTKNHVMVEKRSPWLPVTTFFGAFVFCCVLSLILPGKHNNPSFLQIILKSDGLTDLVILLFICMFSTIFAWGALKLSTAEFLHCDGMRLHYGRKGFGRRWVRASYSRGSITRLRWGLLSIDKNTKINCLMFEIGAYTEHALEGLSLTEADRILSVCRSLNYDVYRDDAEPMLLDIEKRRWFVNPWRPDEPETHPKERQ